MFLTYVSTACPREVVARGGHSLKTFRLMRSEGWAPSENLYHYRENGENIKIIRAANSFEIKATLFQIELNFKNRLLVAFLSCPD